VYNEQTMARIRALAGLIAVLLAVMACRSDVTSPASSGRLTPLATAAEPTGTAPAAASTTDACPVTLGNANTPPGEGQSATNFGNGRLWTVLWPEGVVYVPPDGVEPDGSLGMKFPWWRGPDVSGALTITGHEITRALPIRTDVPDGYGDTGFQATGIQFPAEGCYTVTARAADAELTFVTLVRTCDAVAELAPGRRALYPICVG